MKKIHLLIIFSLFISFCSSNDPVTTEIQNEEADTVITFTQGLTKSSSEYVSNWNKLISEISNDEETLLYFSINPDNVRWTSPERTALFYQFGNSENTSSSFVINLLIQDDRVYGVEFFSPVVNDEISSQRTKLFFLLLIAMADDTLDKEERESVLNKLGLYDDVTSPDQVRGSLTQNNIQYIIEPIIDNGLIIGLNLYTTKVDN
jgi:hypothetical protein